MEKVASEIQAELSLARAQHERMVRVLSDALDSVEKVRWEVEKCAEETVRLSLEWETAIYGMTLPEFIFHNRDQINKMVSDAMENSTYYIGDIYAAMGTTFYFSFFDKDDRNLGNVVISPRRLKTGEVQFDLAYHRKDTTGRVRNYRDFEMTSGIFEETLDLRRAIYAAIRTLIDSKRA